MEHLPYCKKVVSQIPRLLGLQDRDPYSSTRGCFDRSYWAWKLKDFPDATMQRGIYPLSVLYARERPENPYVHNAAIGEWCKAGILYCARIQHPNGSFDQAFPREYGFGPTAFLLYALVRSIPAVSHLFSENEKKTVYEMCKKAARFLARHRETHGFVSNHCAGAAAALADVSALLRMDFYRDCAQKLVETILRRQSSEGWFLEYEGPDPGYETLGISYLASYYQTTRDPNVLNAVRKSVEFLSYCVHPDGTVGGEYGARNTEIFYPAGLEAFSRDIPLALSVCRAMRSSLEKENTAGPECVDDENFIPLLCNYSQAVAEEEKEYAAPAPSLPWKKDEETRYFVDSKIFVKSTRAYYCVCNGSKGGTMKIFAKQSGILRWDDGGYAGKTAGGILCATQIFDPNAVVRYDQNILTVSSRFFRLPTALPTPFKFFILRLFSFTIFRSAMLGNIVKGILVRMLMTKKRPMRVSLVRTIRATETKVEICDTITKSPSLNFQWLECGRKFSAIHMGSAKYFQPSQLYDIPPRPFPLAELHKRSSANVSHTILFE